MATTAAAASMFSTSRFCPTTITTFSCSSKRMQSVRFFTDHFLGLSRSIPTRLIDFPLLLNTLRRPTKPVMDNALQNQKPNSSLFVKGFAVSLAVLASTAAFTSGAAFAAEIPLLGSSSLQFQEPSNALSLPTWAIHVSSVVEWITAMVLVWQYGEKSGCQSWKGLSWGMVPLLGGAFCACTWHFFYNSESLEVLVAIQAALTVIGNFTMCIAAFRIYKASQEGSENS